MTKFVSLEVGYLVDPVLPTRRGVRGEGYGNMSGVWSPSEVRQEKGNINPQS